MIWVLKGTLKAGDEEMGLDIYYMGRSRVLNADFGLDLGFLKVLYYKKLWSAFSSSLFDQ